jgi:hypothetical protein
MRGAALAFDDAMLVRDARDRLLAEEGLSTSGYDAPGFPVRLGPFTICFPNPGLLPWHDLHHVATGYRCDLLGEAEISAFELRAGGATPLIRLLSVGAIAIALFIAPRRVIRAWRRARGARTLYARRSRYEQLLAMRVGELRALCGLAEERLTQSRGAAEEAVLPPRLCGSA